MEIFAWLVSLFCAFSCAPHAVAAPVQTPPAAAVSSSAPVAVPIVVYHLVRPVRPRDTPATKEYSVDPQVFDDEMQYVHDAGYSVVSFASLEDYFDDGTPLPPRPVIISFDDGYEDQYANALPELEKLHFNATFFIPTDYIGGRGRLTWDQVRQIAAAGMTIGAHSRSHPDLAKIADVEVLWNEIYGSKRIIEYEIGTTTDEFAYPYGAYDPLVVQLVKEAGYKSARGFSEGIIHASSSVYTLTTVMATDDESQFEARLAGR